MSILSWVRNRTVPPPATSSTATATYTRPLNGRPTTHSKRRKQARKASRR